MPLKDHDCKFKTALSSCAKDETVVPLSCETGFHALFLSNARSKPHPHQSKDIFSRSLRNSAAAVDIDLKRLYHGVYYTK